MRNRLLVPLVAAFAVGCHGKSPAPVTPPVCLPQVERQLLPPDLSLLADTPPASAEGPYFRLTAEECCKLACAHSTLGNLFSSAADGPPPCPDFGSAAAEDQLRRQVAYHLAQEARIRTAAPALELYYKLQEAELSSDLLVNSRARVADMLATANRLFGQGFRESPELVQLQKQQADLAADAARLQAGIQRANAELKSLIGCPDHPGRLLPVDPIQVRGDGVNPDQAVREGLACRPDLDLLRDLAAQLDNRTELEVRKILAGLLPSYGAVAPPRRGLHSKVATIISCFATSDVEETRGQVVGFLADREKEAAKEIRATFQELTSQSEVVAIVQQRQLAEADRVQKLKIRQGTGAAVETELRKAELDKLKADGEVVRESVKWKQLEVKARQATGQLCGR